MIQDILGEIPKAIDQSFGDAMSACSLLVEDPAITEERKTVAKQLATLEDVEKFVA
jgi:hypothetical protein